MNIAQLFIHSSVDEHLGCFQFWLIEIKLVYQFLYSHRLSFLLDKCPRTELLSCMVDICFTFKTVKTVFQIDCTTLYCFMILA